MSYLKLSLVPAHEFVRIQISFWMETMWLISLVIANWLSGISMSWAQSRAMRSYCPLWDLLCSSVQHILQPIWTNNSWWKFICWWESSSVFKQFWWEVLLMDACKNSGFLHDKRCSDAWDIVQQMRGVMFDFLYMTYSKGKLGKAWCTTNASNECV